MSQTKSLCSPTSLLNYPYTQQNNMSEAEDRISNLPASLLHHILYFVPTCDAARASVLSKRWKYIWRSIPSLHFEFEGSSQVNKFMNFVDTALELHDESNIEEFFLESDVHLSEPQIRKWISTAISHKVEVLTLILNQENPISMPSSIYTCESLTNLKLCSSPGICFPEYISFPRLRRLMLIGVEFIDECWNEQLFSNCPVLEILCMVSCTWSDMKNFCISNPALKFLLILNVEEEDGFLNCVLKIHAPSLESLTYKGRPAKDYALSSIPKLVEVHIDFFYEEFGAMIDYGAVVSKFLRAITHVAYLQISVRTLQVLSVADDLLNTLPSYHNLNQLHLTQKVTVGKALIGLLEKTPNLVSLDFEGFVPAFAGEEEDNSDNSGDDGGEDNHYNEDDGWAVGKVATRCSFLEHLKLVSFDKFTGNEREMRWLKLILNNAKALQALDVSFESISHGKSKRLMANISSLPKASASCLLKFF
ncbi:putative F-box/FBD/LRR-repeat protein At1g78760 [Papaver somniferum]|uniref:putative F-box/FBD/LRR-repeat protein At1g78760 n=1 Tax=Papaver somniferum TaxID=3469 RepID=UPI000E7023D2|nr:putative F-box/FBD/LRR-repeat protein At1g78760 [Papaver somniferum]